MLIHTLTSTLCTSLLSPLPLRSPLLLTERVSLLPRKHSRTLVNRRSKRRDNPLNDVMHRTALRKPRRELDHVALTQGVLRVCNEEVGYFAVGFADLGVVGGVVVGDADGAVHFAD